MEQWLQAQPSPDSSPQSSDSLRQVVVGMRRVVYANPKMCRPSPQVQPNLTRRLLQMLGCVLGCGNFAACMIIYFLSLTCLLTYHIYPLLFALGSFFPQLFCQENLCFGSERCFGSKNLAQSPSRPANCSGFRLYCSECERVCMWKCTQARLAVWKVLISDGGIDIGLLSTLRKLGSPEGSFCCINSECYFQFDPNTPPPPPPPTFVFSRCPSLSAFVF